MQNERKRILTMLENGTITTDEALTLLEALGKPEQKQSSESVAPQEKPFEQSEFSQKTNRQTSHSMDEFLEDLRKDFTNVGDRFMHFMQSTVQKVKEFDFDSPFGHSVTFTETMTKSADSLEELLITIDNGKVTIHAGEEEEIRAEFTVKAFNNESEEKARKDFEQKLLFVLDEGKLHLSSDLKMMQVNVELYIPGKVYERISTRLLNGAFKMKDIEAKKIRVKTANGKIDVSGLTFEDAEIETANGGIDLHHLTGNTLEAETLNGRVYIDGAVKEVEAQSLNGHVVVTTTDTAPKKVDAKTVSGSVEIYIPSDISLTGEISSNMGRLELQLNDVDRTAEQEQVLHRSIRFKKDAGDHQFPLHLFGEAKTGSVLVCYNAKHPSE
ncbi:DUF4097 domain-containing protein [Sporosarcina sp. HYO08]|uniref:DUF4097 family beta strand repeat-containing protein n=1 Tax=Sporosarcina sp. HYO08 TaxID=1759557 RepID=UPI000796DBFC|nr:DUF4097 domain-containing protein [Sporosarcina sp. HYO08]KXH79286.1 hypothetical protein AU377_11940 [Sporosarcina sp. HYO08]